MSSHAWAFVALLLGLATGGCAFWGLLVTRASIQPQPLGSFITGRDDQDLQNMIDKREREARQLRRTTTLSGVGAAVLGVLAGVAGFFGALAGG